MTYSSETVDLKILICHKLQAVLGARYNCLSLAIPLTIK